MTGFFVFLSIVLFFAGISSHGIDEKTPVKGTIRYHVFGICETAFVLLPIFNISLLSYEAKCCKNKLAVTL